MFFWTWRVQVWCASQTAPESTAAYGRQMRENASWSLLSLSVGFVLAMLGLPDRYEWVQPYLLAGAAACLVLSALCFAWPLRNKDARAKCVEVCNHPFRLAKLVEPVHIIILGLLIALSGAIWMWRVTPSIAAMQAMIEKQGQEISDLKTTSPEVESLRTQLAAKEREAQLARTQASKDIQERTRASVPEIPKDTAALMARYVQVKATLPRMKSIRDSVVTAGDNFRDILKPKLSVMMIGSSMRDNAARSAWSATLDGMKQIRDTLYPSRPLDLESAPALIETPTLDAPGDEVFGSDKKTQYQYRLIHYRNANILKQADELLAQIEQEFNRLHGTIVSTPSAEILTK